MVIKLYEKLHRSLFTYSDNISKRKALSLVQEHLKQYPDDVIGELFLIVIYQLLKEYTKCISIFEKYKTNNIKIERNKYSTSVMKGLNLQAENLIEEKLYLEALNLIDFLRIYQKINPEIIFVRFQFEIFAGNIELGLNLFDEYIDTITKTDDRVKSFQRLIFLLDHPEIDDLVKAKIQEKFLLPYEGESEDLILRKLTCNYKTTITYFIVGGVMTTYYISFFIELPYVKEGKSKSIITCPICLKELTILNQKNKLKIKYNLGSSHKSDKDFNKQSLPYKKTKNIRLSEKMK